MTKITFNYRKHLKWQGAILLLLFFFGLKGFSQENLITNGDFESSGGWQVWNYGFINPATGTSNPAQYASVTNAQQFNSNFTNATGRSGSGNFLAFDMLLTGGQQHFFGVGNNGGGVCALNTTVTHTFSYWVRSISSGSRAEIDVLFNNASNVQLVSGSKIAPDVNDGWQQVIYTFTPTNNCVNITLRHTNANNLADGLGNDFALDDLSLTAPPAPLTIEFFSNPASCPGNNDAYIEASRFGGTGPFSYDLLNSLGATVATNAEGNFINLAPDTYTVRVSDGLGATATTPNIQLQAPTEITTSPNVTICNGASTNLTVSGSTSTYTWTAQPADGSITDPTLPNQTVSPTQTTIYTVASTVVTNSSDALNLLTNGGFGAGNNGFETDYNFTPDNTIAKAQKAYGIVANPKAWEPDFSTCSDRSTDNDLMMVVDGSATGGNNERVWSQTVNGLKLNTDYIFSYWVQSVAALSPANLETQINGSVIGTALAPSTACGWIRRFYRWNTGASNSAIISIIDRNTVVAGNDFALDEMSFAEAIICNLEKSVTVTVNPTVQAAFSFDTSYNMGEVPVVLPTTSDNGITGTWSPAAISTSTEGSINYEFTPNDPSQCASGQVGVLVTINNVLQIDPTFTLPATICRGEVVNLLLTSDNGIIGTWNPAAVDNTQSGSYLFTPNGGQNANTFAYNLTVNQPVDLTFPAINTTYCVGASADALPNPNGGITGSWSAASISTASVGTVDYVFTADSGCFNPFTLPVTVNTLTDLTFPVINTTYCVGVPADALPSPNGGFSGSWSSATINTAVAGTVNYVFTPDAGCFNPFVLPVTVTSPTDLTFPAINTTYCIGASADALPNPNEVVTGIWSAASISTASAGTVDYIFTPNAGQCFNPFTLSVTVNPIVDLTFPAINTTYCLGASANALPNPNGGITGSWSAASISTASVGTVDYVFTADSGCFNPFTLPVTVNTLTDLTFPVINTTYCVGASADALPSPNESVTGSWSAASISTASAGTVNYVFTADSGCFNLFTLPVTVNPTITAVEITGNCVDIEYIVEATPVSGSFDPNAVTYSWADSNGAPIGNGTSKLNVSVLNLAAFPATVNLTVTNGSGCSITESYIVQTDFCEIPKGVSPNGDGKNDTFDLSGLNPKLVQIFNRYGVKVFEGTNYTNQWYGQTNDGDELPAATYYYVAEFNSGETKTGWVYLAR